MRLASGALPASTPARRPGWGRAWGVGAACLRGPCASVQRAGKHGGGGRAAAAAAGSSPLPGARPSALIVMSWFTGEADGGCGAGEGLQPRSMGW